MADLSYKIENLKEAQPKLEQVDNYILIPLMDQIIEQWDTKLRSGSDIVTDYREEYNSYLLATGKVYVVDGKIVFLRQNHMDIDWTDDDETWSMIEEVRFHCLSEEPAKKLYNHLVDFSKNQDLAQLIQSAKAELSKDKIYHLRQDLKEFYFKKE